MKRNGPMNAGCTEINPPVPFGAYDYGFAIGMKDRDRDPYPLDENEYLNEEDE